MSKTIFITGASRGFGKIWAEAFLKRGDKVVATARDINKLDHLVKEYGDSILTIQLDVNNRAAGFAAIKKAKEHFGSLDVVINNAGYGLFGTIEETSEEQAREQLETNVFGLLWITQAAIPVMREQGFGHIIQVSSVLGVVTLPILGIYTASKFAVEGLSESLAAEVKDFGIKITLVEPNTFSTDWYNTSAIHTDRIEAYDQLKESFYGNMTEDSIGKPEATVDAVLQLADNENPPLRLFLGKMAYPWTKYIYEERLKSWEEWSEVSAAAHG
ncbi:SDR family NAD(P)-dependent oxidoreductase [Pedobacter sp. L105]|uniref:SDR family NAD(P)-dependent oxidoreductase n=1 Tax=Pedobacter sp. L105 TaxID=1641871 RepID=UPI00131C8F43|nr:SDR family NAD(P)-dependent oxidoreductase [Pedobacter sp. L105]